MWIWLLWLLVVVLSAVSFLASLIVYMGAEDECSANARDYARSRSKLFALVGGALALWAYYGF